MTSWLIDALLVAALVVTSWRTGAMYRELRRLRTDETALRAALVEADASINRAANAVVLLATVLLIVFALLRVVDIRKEL